MLIILALSLVATFDFGVSFFGLLADGATAQTVYGLISKLIFDTETTAKTVFSFFAISSLVSLAAGIVNIILACINVMKRELEL